MRCSFKEQSAEEGLWWEDQPGKGGEGQTQARARPSLETAEGGTNPVRCREGGTSEQNGALS